PIRAGNSTLSVYRMEALKRSRSAVLSLAHPVTAIAVRATVTAENRKRLGVLIGVPPHCAISQNRGPVTCGSATKDWHPAPLPPAMGRSAGATCRMTDER